MASNRSRRFLAVPLLACVAAAVLAGGGCSSSKARQPTQPEIEAFVAQRVEEGRSNAARRPPRSAKALENAQDALALDEASFDAWLIASDAYYQLRLYPDSLKAALRAEALQPKSQEAAYRKARAYYWYHSYWTRGNYARAREAARACLALGDTYLVECHAIIRNSYLGEAASKNGPSERAYAKAAESGEELFKKLPPGHAARGDVALLLAEYYGLRLGNRDRGASYLRMAREAAATRPDLARRVAAFDRDRQLERVLREDNPAESLPERAVDQKPGSLASAR